MQTDAVVIHRHGGPDVLEHERRDAPRPGPGEVAIRQSAIGLNFADIYQRRGQSGPHAETRFPAVLGSVGAGVVTAVGEGVTDFAEGDAAAYLYAGAYMVERVVPASRVVKLPAGIAEDFAAAWLLRGLTAEYLLRRLYPVMPGERILVHAAAGGMGLVLTQWGKALGAQVIGTVGSAGKAELALRNGCDAVILYREQDLVAAVDDLTGGEGVSVVYDAVGEDVFLPSLECLRPMGWMVSYGAASGPVSPFDIQRLHHHSLIVTRPTLRTYVATTQALRTSAAAFFGAIGSGAVSLPAPRRYDLADVRQAHSDLESGHTTGVSVLIP